MAAVLALLLIVPGSLIVMSIFMIAWTFLFTVLHVIGELARPMRDHARARAQRSEARRVDAVKVSLVLPERAAGLHAATDTLAA
jgi:fatty acid desaturase